MKQKEKPISLTYSHPDCLFCPQPKISPSHPPSEPPFVVSFSHPPPPARASVLVMLKTPPLSHPPLSILSTNGFWSPSLYVLPPNNTLFLFFPIIIFTIHPNPDVPPPPPLPQSKSSPIRPSFFSPIPQPAIAQAAAVHSVGDAVLQDPAVVPNRHRVRPDCVPHTCLGSSRAQKTRKAISTVDKARGGWRRKDGRGQNGGRGGVSWCSCYFFWYLSLRYDIIIRLFIRNAAMYVGVILRRG